MTTTLPEVDDVTAVPRLTVEEVRVHVAPAVLAAFSDDHIRHAIDRVSSEMAGEGRDPGRTGADLYVGCSRVEQILSASVP